MMKSTSIVLLVLLLSYSTSVAAKFTVSPAALNKAFVSKPPDVIRRWFPKRPHLSLSDSNVAAAPSTTIGRIGGNVPVYPARPPLSLSDDHQHHRAVQNNNNWWWRDIRRHHRPQLAALSDGPVRGGATSGRPRRPRLSLSDGAPIGDGHRLSRPDRPGLSMSDRFIGHVNNRPTRPNRPGLSLSDRSYEDIHSRVVGPKKVRLAMGDDHVDMRAIRTQLSKTMTQTHKLSPRRPILSFYTSHSDAQLRSKRPLPAEATASRHWSLFADGEARLSPKKPLLSSKNPKPLSDGDAQFRAKSVPPAEATSGGFNFKFSELFKFPKLFADDDVDVDAEALQLDEMKKDMKKKLVREHKKKQKKGQHGKRGKKIAIKRRRD